MADFYFIRHGEAEWSEIDRRQYRGFGNDLAPLSDIGINTIKNTAKADELKDVDVILASPYTRTTQSAGVLAKELGKDFKVELDLMEWIPDKNFMYTKHSEVVAWRKEYDENDGKHADDTQVWEEKESIKNRVISVLKKYDSYSKVAIVTHGMVMNALTGIIKPDCGQIVKYNLPKE